MKGEGRPDQSYRPRTFFSESTTSKRKQRPCPVCRDNHGIYNCEMFHKMDVPRRWEVTKQLKLCFRCLSGRHQGFQCRQSRTCAVNGCRGNHHRLLHLARAQDSRSNSQTLTVRLSPEREQAERTPAVKVFAASSDDTTEPAPAMTSQVGTEGEHQIATERSLTTVTLKTSEAPHFVALRTVPVVLKNGKRRMEVNALLDDASTRTYLNADVAAELGLQGHCQRVTVNVLNGRAETFETAPVELEVESLDGKISKKINAFTTDRVTGSLRIIDWAKESEKWKHLQGIQFPKQSSARPIVDNLIGIDCLDLHYSYEDVQGLPGEPIARRTPLGWTCIGTSDSSPGRRIQTNFIHAYFVREESKLEEIDTTLRKFWEIEAVNTEESVMSFESRIAVEKVEKSLKFVDGRYQVPIPWKENAPELQDNFEMAFRRLQCTEKKLLKKPDIAKAYSDCIEQYTSKGYIRKVPSTEDRPLARWFLPQPSYSEARQVNH